MKTQKLGYIILIIGVLLVAFPLVSDSLGFGKQGIQAAQLSLLQAGVLVVFIGIGFLSQANNEILLGESIKNAWNKALNLPNSTWVLLGFFIAYFIFFILYAFLNPLHRVQYFNRYIPDMSPIGHDLTFTTSNIKHWLSGNSLYDLENHYYPPLSAIIFAPLLLLSYPASYYLITAIILASMALCFCLIPLLVKRNEPAILVFFFLTVIFSYGMQFELERGQFNVFAFALTLVAIYLYHNHNSFRYLAYLLFSAAIQIKLYPAIFILMFIKDWRDWKNNILRFAGLGIFNFILLFALGYNVFLDFIRTLPTLMNAVWIRPYNHSLQSFVNDLTSSGLGIFPPATVSWLSQHAALIKYSLMGYYFACLLIVLVRAYKNNENKINFDLLFICTIGALILPSVSIDYKLPILSPALALALSYPAMESPGIKRAISILLITIVSFAYSVTLIPFIYRPTYIGSCFLMFMIILTGVTLLNLVENRSYNEVSN